MLGFNAFSIKTDCFSEEFDALRGFGRFCRAMFAAGETSFQFLIHGLGTGYALRSGYFCGVVENQGGWKASPWEYWARLAPLLVHNGGRFF